MTAGTIRGFSGDLATLEQRFRLSARMKARVGVLMSAGLLLSEGVLECAGPASPLERFLLAGDLVKGAPGLDPEALAALVAVQRNSVEDLDEYSLALVAKEGARVIALEEEVLAMQAWGARQAPASSWREDATPPARILDEDSRLAMIAVPGHFGASQLASRESQASGLPPLGFDSEAARRIKLSILAGVSPEEKISALRSLQLSDAPLRERGPLFLSALHDSEGTVRAEAARALASIGLSPEICEAIRKVSIGVGRESQIALARLVTLVSEANEPERGVVATVLCGFLRDEKDVGARRDAVRALCSIAPHAPWSPAAAAEAARNCIEVMELSGDEEGCRMLLEELGRAQPEAIGRSLLKELERPLASPVRFAILSALAGMPGLDGDEGVIAKLAAEVGPGRELESGYLRLWTQLIALSERAIPPLLARLESVSEDDVACSIVRLLDQVATEGRIGATTKNRVFAAFLDRFRVSPAGMRSVILGSCLLGDAAIGKRLRAALARELLREAAAARLPRHVDEVGVALRKLGLPAFREIRSALRKKGKVGALAAAFCGDVSLALSEDRGEGRSPERTAHETGEEIVAEISGAIDFILDALDFGPEAGSSNAGTLPARGDLLRSLGKMGSHPQLPEKTAGRLTEIFLDRLPRSSYPYEMLEALGWLAAAPGTPMTLKLDVCHLFLDLVGGRFPEVLSSRKKTEEGEVFVLGRRTAAYTEMIPALIEGLERICLSGAVPAQVRRRVIESLLDKFRDLLAYKLLWGPGNTQQLASVLGRIAGARLTSRQNAAQVVEALASKRNHMPFIDILSDLAGLLEGDAGLDAAFASVAREALEMVDDDDYLEDRPRLLAVLGRLALRRRLGRDKEESHGLKETLVEALLEAGRHPTSTMASRAALARLAGSSSLPAAIRREVTARLERLGENLPLARTTQRIESR